MYTDTENLKSRKQQLELELQLIQSQLESTFDDIKDDVREKANPMYWIKKYPLRAVGIAFAAGFLFAKLRNKDGQSDSFASLLATELKRVATQKAVGFVVNTIEDHLDREK